MSVEEQPGAIVRVEQELVFPIRRSHKIAFPDDAEVLLQRRDRNIDDAVVLLLDVFSLDLAEVRRLHPLPLVDSRGEVREGGGLLF